MRNELDTTLEGATGPEGCLQAQVEFEDSDTVGMISMAADAVTVHLRVHAGVNYAVPRPPSEAESASA